jgi:hypothetical protein
MGYRALAPRRSFRAVRTQEIAMTVCPVALAVGCRRCPVFSVCPATRLIGDQPDAEAKAEAAPKKSAAGAKKKS